MKMESIKMHEKNMVYALKNNNLVHISEVEKGIKCECLCPACGESLIAKKGDYVTHHFAHKSRKECEYGYQTSLHLLAKDIIAKAKKFLLPDLYINFEGTHGQMLIQNSIYINVNEVVLEKKINTIIPDILLKTDRGNIIVEIYVTHQVDNDKIKKMHDLGLSAIEIDLSDVDRIITEKELKDIIENSTEKKKWICFKHEEDCKKKLIEKTEKRSIHQNGNVYGCPLKKRRYKNTYYARLLHDCYNCDFFIDLCERDDIQNFRKIVCSGKSKVANWSDIFIEDDVRQQKYEKRRKKEELDNINKRICPICGEKLIVKEGKYGKFLGCVDYPRCTFSTNIK